MTIAQALACGIVYWLSEANVPYVTVWTLQKPLVCGWITGILLGCPAEGAVCGALCSLITIGYRSTGSSMPGDIALAGICAAAAVSAGAPGGLALWFGVPAYFAGILIWRLRLHINRSFGEHTEKLIRQGRRWEILLPSVLQPSFFSALICIPVGALFTVAARSAGSLAVTASPSAGAGLSLLWYAGLFLPLIGLLLTLLQRGKTGRMAFLLGAGGGLLCLPGRIPLLAVGAVSLPLCALAVRALERQELLAAKRGEEAAVEERKTDPDFDPDFDPDIDMDYDPDYDPDLDSDYDPDFDPDYDPDYDPDLASGSGPYGGPEFNPDLETGVQAETEDILKKQPYVRISHAALAASNLLWILFVQAAYNTKRMMGQAAAAAFLPVIGELCPGDPEGQQEILLRQCEYLNTQPETGSCLIGYMIALEAQKSFNTFEKVDAAQIRTVRSALMGTFGGIGDELFQCGWIPALLLIASDLTLRSGGDGRMAAAYIAAAVLSAGALSGACFVKGLHSDGTGLLNLLEGVRLRRFRILMSVWLPLLQGAMLVMYVHILYF